MSRNVTSRQHGRITLLRVSILAVSCAAVGLTAGVRAQEHPDPITKARTERLELAGGGAGLIAARALGVKEIMGKPVATEARGPRKELEAALESITPTSHETPSPVTDKPGRSANNVAIRDFPNVSENEPTVAANPRNPSKIVAGTHFIGDTANRCIAHYSRDGGKTWNPRPIFMPQLKHDTPCSDPVLAYAPDGSRVYYAYMDIDVATTFKIVVSYSDDDGKSWKGPIVALSMPASDYDKPWIGTHVPVGGGDDDDDDSDQSNRNWVYVTATRFDNTPPFGCHIDFTRSSDGGTTWSAPTPLDTSVGGCGDPDPGPLPSFPVVQGSRPTGGLGNDVLVAWYHSGVDGWLEGNFNIRTRYSSNNGASFDPIVVAAPDTFELPFWLGPFAAYHRWWGGMFPDVEIAPNGSGHLVYTHDPTANPGGFSTGTEDGNIRYIGSTGPPYAAWSAPATVNDDASGKAQGWATLEADSKRSTATRYAMWEDHRTSATDNQSYDVFWSKKVGSGTWAPNGKLTDEQSASDYIFVGDYYDITLAKGGDDSGRFVYGVWTDRRDEPTILDFDDDIWGSRLPPVPLADDDDDDDDDDRHHED